MPDDKYSKRKLIKVEDEIIEAVQANTIRLRLMKDLKLNAIGKVTGNRYTFNGAGSILDVDEQDAEYLLNKNTVISCCGSKGSPYFEVVR